MLNTVFTNGQYTPVSFLNGRGDKHDFGAGYEDVWYESTSDDKISVKYYQLTTRFNRGYIFPVGESYNHNLLFEC